MMKYFLHLVPFRDVADNLPNTHDEMLPTALLGNAHLFACDEWWNLLRCLSCTRWK